MDTDASDVGLGAVLSQVQSDGSERVVAYGSRVLSKAERKYSVTRRELLAVVVFITHFRLYILGCPFLLRTDHGTGALLWLRSFKNPEGQLARWLEKLQEYSFTVVHRPGKKHLNADALSRRPEHTGDSDQSAETSDISANAICFGRSDSDLRALQLDDEAIGVVLRAKEANNQLTKDDVSGKSHVTRRLVQIWDQLVLSKGVLMREYLDEKHGTSHKQLVVPKALQADVLDELHAGISGGHLGIDKTLSKLKLRFYWPGHYQDVQNWCKACVDCATRKSPAPKNRAPLGSIPAGNPGQFVSVDILGPFPEDSKANKYILVVVDHFTKWGEAFPIPNQEAITVAQVLCNEWFFRFSPPEGLHSDQGRQFESKLLQEICRILQIKKTHTSPYHPQGNGVAEQFNRTLLNMLAVAAKNNTLDWASFIRPLCFAYNSSQHAVTGYSPFFMTFGREARLPVDLAFGYREQATLSPVEYVRSLQQSLDYAYGLVRDTVGETQRRHKTLYDRKVHGPTFEVGDKVWLYSTVVPSDSHRKLHHPWTGPYEVMSKLSDVNYKIALIGGNDKTFIVHFDRLKRCTPGSRPSVHCNQHPCAPNHQVGDRAELVDSVDSNEDHDDPPHLQPVPLAEPRYPQRVRRAPDRLLPYVTF